MEQSILTYEEVAYEPDSSKESGCTTGGGGCSCSDCVAD